MKAQGCEQGEKERPRGETKGVPDTALTRHESHGTGTSLTGYNQRHTEIAERGRKRASNKKKGGVRREDIED